MRGRDGGGGSPSSAQGAGSTPFPPNFTVIARLVDRWWSFIDRAAVHYIVPQHVIQGIIHQESGGDPDAVRVEPRVRDMSVGLMQLLTRTAIATGFNGPVRELFDPAVNIDLGVHYYTNLRHAYGNTAVSLAAYNGGHLAAVAFSHGLGWPAVNRYVRNVTALGARYESWNRMYHWPVA